MYDECLIFLTLCLQLLYLVSALHYSDNVLLYFAKYYWEKGMEGLVALSKWESLHWAGSNYIYVYLYCCMFRLYNTIKS